MEHRPQRLRVVVVHRPSAWRLGVAAALEAARFAVSQTERVATFGDDVGAVVAIVDSPAEEIPALVCEVDGRTPIVAVLTQPLVCNHADAIRAGADGVIGCDASAADLASVVVAATRRRVVLPLGVARAIAAMSPPMVVINESEVCWLSDLAQGAAVSEIAVESEVSVEVMARRLRLLYVRMGVQGRTEAVKAAAAAGLISWGAAPNRCTGPVADLGVEPV